MMNFSALNYRAARDEISLPADHFFEDMDSNSEGKMKACVPVDGDSYGPTIFKFASSGPRLVDAGTLAKVSSLLNFTLPPTSEQARLGKRRS
jgi:hypothetical protein